MRTNRASLIKNESHLGRETQFVVVPYRISISGEWVGVTSQDEQ